MRLIGICGYSGSGKTTLLKKLIPALQQRGIRLAVIKHSHHNMEIDTPGKDSYELRKAGAAQVMVACNQRWAMVTETINQSPNLMELAGQFCNVDLVLVEGFKEEPITKIVCHRSANQKPLFYDSMTIAIATDCALDIDIQQFDNNNVHEIAEFIQLYLSN